MCFKVIKLLFPLFLFSAKLGPMLPALTVCFCLHVESSVCRWESLCFCLRKKSYFFLFPYSLSSEKAMAPHSSTLAWKIPWMEEPGGLQSMGSLRVRHDWATSLSLFTFMHWRRKWQPTPVFLPGDPRDGGAWQAAIYGVAQSRTRLKRLSSSSSIVFPWSIT